MDKDQTPDKIRLTQEGYEALRPLADEAMEELADVFGEQDHVDPDEEK
jgi:hypothetical protein